MKYGTFPGSRKPVGRIVQGTIMLHADRQAECDALLNALFDEGCNAFDSGHNYGGGGAERALGRWMAARGVRDDVFVLTKGCHFNADRDRVTPYDLSSDLHDSLARLRTDHIDLYLLHRDDARVPVGPLVERLHQHKEEGKILAYGGSNWSPARIEEANRFARAHGMAPFAASSPNFSLAEPIATPYRDCLTISGAAGAQDRAYYRHNGMPLFTWSSLAMGFFTGRFSRDNLDTFTDAFDRVAIRAYGAEINFQRLDRVRQVGAALGLTPPQVATAYVLSYPLNIFALIGCRTPSEWRANAAALAAPLAPAMLAWLETGTGAMPV